MTDEELKEKMKKDLREIFDGKAITNFILDLVQKAYAMGIETGIAINGTEKNER